MTDYSDNIKALNERIRELEEEKRTLLQMVWKYRGKPSKIFGIVLLSSGFILIGLSIFVNSLILAFIGLSLTFWGALLTFIRPTEYVRHELFDYTAFSSILAIDRILSGLNYQGKGIYLPHKYLKGLGGLVFVPAKKEITIPPVEELIKEKAFLRNPEGLCLPSVGLGLVTLYEKELRINFSLVDLDYLQLNLPKLLVKGLEIFEDFGMDVNNNIVHVEMVGSIYKGFCRETRKLSNICQSFGCPICGSIACIISKATGKPVVIENTGLIKDNTIEAWYRIVEGE